MKKHSLKCIEPYFTFVNEGYKTFEVRLNDRNYQTGDIVILNKYPDDGSFPLLFKIGYILQNFKGLAPNYIVFQLEPIEEGNSTDPKLNPSHKV